MNAASGNTPDPDTAIAAELVTDGTLPLQSVPPIEERVPSLAITLALLATLGPYTMDAFFPSLRAMAASFGVSYWQVQQAITAFMLPYAFMSLIHGSVSDALGRRRVILLALGIYTLASIGCVLAPSFGILLAMRFLQGAVAGAGMVVGRAMIRDRHDGAAAQRLMSTVTVLFSLGPAIAPIIGGWVFTWFGWRAVFGTMVLYGAMLYCIVWRRLPETHPHERRVPFEPRALLRRVLGVIGHAEFVTMTFSSAFCMVALHVYIGSAPAIILDHWHMGATAFASLTLPIIGGYAIGAFVSGRLAGRFPAARQAQFGFSGLLLFTGAMLVLQWSFDEAPIFMQQILLGGSAIALQLMYPVVTLRILDLFSSARGAAASAHTFFSLLLATLTMGVFAPWLGQSMRRLALTAFVMTLAGGLLWRRAGRYRVA